MSVALLEVDGLVKQFGSLKAVDEVGFQVRSGEICGFIGPNGAGKTTTMRIISTLEMPDRGDVRVAGYSALTEARDVRQCLGFMPDSFGAYPSTTVLEYLDFFARAYQLRGEARRNALSSVVEFTHLGELLGKPVVGLSKGMRQRLCLAKTLLHDPQVLILDEPASGLDPRARVELRELVKALAELGKAVLISSHILTELAEICTSVVVIERGKLQASGSLDEIEGGVAKRREVFARTLQPDIELQRFLSEQPFVESLRLEKGGAAFEFTGSEEQRAQLLAALLTAGLQPVEFGTREVDLEDIFMQLTEGRVQ